MADSGCTRSYQRPLGWEGLFSDLKLHSGQGGHPRRGLTSALAELSDAAAEEGGTTGGQGRGTRDKDPRGRLCGL